jgi:hydrogenase maturation protease
LPPGPVAIAGGREEEPLGERASIVRSWLALEGSIDVTAERLREDLHRVTVRIENTTPFAGSREESLEQTFCSCHAVLRAGIGAELVSLTDPPSELREAAEACVNEGVWPVLVGEPHERATMLASPIILEDHPRVAPESPGDLFDGGEIDQMLVLNILALTDEEKEEMRASDPKARAILERTEALTPEELMRLSGRLTDLRYVR